MKIVFNNNEELVVNYFSVADGQMLIKTDFVNNQKELEDLFNDFLATRKITKVEKGVETSYENYTSFDEITRNIKTNEYTIVMSLDGSDYTSQIEAFKRDIVDEVEKLKKDNNETVSQVNASIKDIKSTKNTLEAVANDIEKINSTNDEINSQLTDLQLALVEIYEGMSL